MRRATAALLVLVSLAVPSISPAIAHTLQPAPTPNVTAYGAAHRVLPRDPLLAPGDAVQLVVTGFGPGSDVTVVGAGTAPYRHQRADGQGVVRMRYVVPTNLPRGDHYVSFSGVPAAMPTPAFDPDDTGNPNHIRATVPVFGLFPFRTPPPGTTPSGSGAGGTGGGVGGLSDTGVAVVAMLLVGAVLILAGVTVVRLTRRG